MEIIQELKNTTSKKEFREGLIDLIFKKANNNAESKESKYIYISNELNKIEDYAFIDNISLKFVIINEPISNIGYKAFSECISLKRITIPKSVKIINYYVFQNCFSLKSINIPKSAIRFIDFANSFQNCVSLYINNPENNKENNNDILNA